MIRASKNPVVTRHDIPDIKPHLVDATSVFNPGAIKIGDKYILMLRVQNRGRRTFFVVAESDNGIDFDVDNKIVEFKGIENVKDTIHHCYDPRITKLGDTYYLMFAMEMEGYTRLGMGKTADFKEFEWVGIVSENDNRNGVLFPEQKDGYYMRYDRPNTHQVEGGPLTGNSIYFSRSKDLINWEEVGLVAKGCPHYWDELIGAGPPPVKTEKGWLLIYHGIAMHYEPIYQAGVMLLDLDDPQKIISRGTQCILEPRELFEHVGQVPNVIFPTGLVVEDMDENGFAKMDSEVKLYYGAADLSVGLATSTIKKLIEKCYN